MALIEVGAFARDSLAGGAGEVCAVFRRSVYLRFGAKHYVCIGDRSLGRGPLNALVSDWRRLASLAVGDCFGLSTAEATLWRPTRLPQHVSGPRLAARLDALTRAAAGRTPGEGLGGAITGATSSLLEYARPAFAALDRWLAGSPQDPIPAQAEMLIGLGPGLTPSGDDYLAGILITLPALDRAEAAAALWRWLAVRTDRGTSAISAAHLAAAAAGEAHEALHDCLNALLGAKTPRWKARFAALDRVGHCSGWDGLAGALAVARQAIGGATSLPPARRKS